MNEIFKPWRKFRDKMRGQTKIGPPSPEKVEIPSSNAGAPIQYRQTAMIDPPQLSDGGFDFKKALDTIEADVTQLFLKSDRTFQEPGAEGDEDVTNTRMENRLANLQGQIEDKKRELTALEGAMTITPWEAKEMRERLESFEEGIAEFRELKAHAPTLDMDIYHIGKKIRGLDENLKIILKSRIK